MTTKHFDIYRYYLNFNVDVYKISIVRSYVIVWREKEKTFYNREMIAQVDTGRVKYIYTPSPRRICINSIPVFKYHYNTKEQDLFPSDLVIQPYIDEPWCRLHIGKPGFE